MRKRELKKMVDAACERLNANDEKEYETSNEEAEQMYNKVIEPFFEMLINCKDEKAALLYLHQVLTKVQMSYDLLTGAIINDDYQNYIESIK